MNKMNVKQKMLQTLTKKTGYNTFSVAQGRVRFGVKNIAARIAELRTEGYSIYTNIKSRKDGSKFAVYRLGTPSKTYKALCRAAGIRLQTV